MEQEEQYKNHQLKNSLTAKGLCVNCNDAEICKFPRFGQEVVFCEEHDSNTESEKQTRSSHKSFTDVPDLGVKNLIPGWEE